MSLALFIIYSSYCNAEFPNSFLMHLGMEALKNKMKLKFIGFKLKIFLAITFKSYLINEFSVIFCKFVISFLLRFSILL